MLPLRVVTNFVISSLRNFDRMQPLGARGGLVMQGELVDIHDIRRRRQSETSTFPPLLQCHHFPLNRDCKRDVEVEVET